MITGNEGENNEPCVILAGLLAKSPICTLYFFQLSKGSSFSKVLSEVFLLSSLLIPLPIFFLTLDPYIFDSLSVLYSPLPSHLPGTAGDSFAGVFNAIILIPDPNSQQKIRISYFMKAFLDFVSIKSVSPIPVLLWLYSNPGNPY